MALQYRVRYLRQTGDGEVELPSGGDGAMSVFGEVSARAGAVYQVAANEFEVSADAIVEELRSGDLKPTDLVLIDGTWMPLVDSQPFGELATAREAALTLRRNLRYGLALGGAVVFAVLVILLKAFAAASR